MMIVETAAAVATLLAAGAAQKHGIRIKGKTLLTDKIPHQKTGMPVNVVGAQALAAAAGGDMVDGAVIWMATEASYNGLKAVVNWFRRR